MSHSSQPILEPFTVAEDERIEACVPSRGRNPNLCVLLQALRTQTFQGFDVTVLDDNPDTSLRDDFTVRAMLDLLELEGHRCRILRGPCQGLMYAQNTLLMASKKRLVARLDDDTVPQPHTLERLMKILLEDNKGDVAAVSGPIPAFVGGKLADYALPDPQSLAQYAAFETPQTRYVHPEGAAPRRMTSLYSSFIYKRAWFVTAGGFSLSYSRIAEKEDADITLRVAFLGGVLVFVPSALSWHLKAPMGGIRHLSNEERQQLFTADYLNFVERAKTLGQGEFPWERERQANLEPFQKWLELEDEARGYIER
ncbi:MAG: glycosyltransferase family 2 protein [Myxococcota bacterium]|jgi:GT2 family glycosyltransferase|nr:glycosyltransferase family 2 protein [Myxococcota bacterium]